MLPVERQNRILEIIAQRQSVSVDDLCNTLYSSGATIRRDLKILENSGLIRRTHGGAVYIGGGARDFPMMMRENEHLDLKAKIAKKALPLIQDGQTLFMDSSSTVCQLAQQLAASGHLHDLRVITNGLKTATILSKAEGVRVYMTGGALRENAMSLIGTHAQEFASRFHADWAFISCRGVSTEVGITDANEDESSLKSVYIRNAKRTVVLADSSKIGQQFFCKLANLSDVWEILSDEVLPSRYQRSAER